MFEKTREEIVLGNMGFKRSDVEWIKDLGWVLVVVKDRQLLARSMPEPGEFVDLDEGVRQLKEIKSRLKGESIIE
ncbi:MAG: hypothetical protein A2Y16_05470 [Tenericutes bacterium GWF2_57_13]|nr:MAG: hypothetical protein A2Y16_05470 [Tenericutes bacterium GWF2_57_13]